MHVCTHAHTGIHTYIYYTDMVGVVYIQNYMSSKHIGASTELYVLTYVRTHTDIHTYIQNLDIYTQYIRTCMHTCIHTDVHTYTYIHEKCCMTVYTHMS